MNDTFGPNISGSSSHADPLSCSENKSHHPSLSENRVCRGCQGAQPIDNFRQHNKGGRRWTCRSCENGWVRTTKPWSSRAKKEYQKRVRLERRGLSLVSDAKRRAKTKGIPFDLDWRDIQRRLDLGKCEITSLPFDLMSPKAWNAPSLDQIRPGAGYTKENTRVVLYSLNVMLGTWGVEIMLKVADAARRAE